MSVTAYGIGSSDYVARPDFTARRDAKGAWSASCSFSMLRETWENLARGLFLKGTPITQLYPELSPYWSFLVLEEVEVGNEPGGITIARCQWTGWTDAEYDEKEDVVYALSGTRVERSIEHHPLYRKEIIDSPAAQVRTLYKQILAGVIKGLWKINEFREPDPDVVYLVSVTDAMNEVPIENQVVKKWAERILIEGWKTYMAPTLQWTEETSSKTGWRDKDLNKLGLVEYDGTDRPPGSPPMPEYGKFNWLKTSMNQSKSGQLVEQSQTWELSPPGGFQPAELYDYNLEDLEAIGD